MPQCLDRTVKAERGEDRRQRLGIGLPRRQRQLVAMAVARHRQDAGLARAEGHAVAAGLGAEHGMAARQRRVPAQRDLGGGREPAQLIVRLAARVGHHEGGFGQVVLRRDLLERRVVEPTVERHHRRRIAGEGSVREGVDLQERDLHISLLSAMAAGSAPS